MRDPIEAELPKESVDSSTLQQDVVATLTEEPVVASVTAENVVTWIVHVRSEQDHKAGVSLEVVALGPTFEPVIPIVAVSFVSGVTAEDEVMANRLEDGAAGDLRRGSHRAGEER